MNKRAARERALSGKVSIGELRALILTARGRYIASKVNPGIPHDKALDIYEAALGERDDTEVPTAWRTDPYSRTGRQKPTADVLLITNILRDSA